MAAAREPSIVFTSFINHRSSEKRDTPPLGGEANRQAMAASECRGLLVEIIIGVIVTSRRKHGLSQSHPSIHSQRESYNGPFAGGSLQKLGTRGRQFPALPGRPS
jgi:hypothetical protein